MYSGKVTSSITAHNLINSFLFFLNFRVFFCALHPPKCYLENNFKQKVCLAHDPVNGLKHRR